MKKHNVPVPNWRSWIKSNNLCRKWLDDYLRRGLLKKSRLSKELYLKKSQHNIDFANWVFDKHKEELPKLFGDERFYDWCISAYYYAIYHAALALIAIKDYSSKSHSATLCAVIWFYYHQRRSLEEKDIELIKDSINKEDIELITETKNLRERASYDASADFEIILVEKARNNAINFLIKVRSILE